MGSSFGGLSIGISAIFAQQRALDITGHNISNANTPGYSRQVVSHAASMPDYFGRTRAGGILQFGTGVDVQEIKQYRDEFLEKKLRNENNALGYWTTKQAGIEELETIFNDNTEEGLQSVMDNFWNSWAQLAKPTGGLTARSLVKESAIAFVETVKNMDQLLTNFRKNKDTEINENITRLNTIAKDIAGLNFRIKKEESAGATANDLRDERANLIKELSQLAKIDVLEEGTLTIRLEGRLLVDDTNYEQIELVKDPGNNGYSKLTWQSTKDSLTMNGGSLKAMFETRDVLVDGFRKRLNELVVGVAAEVNKIHRQGYGIKENDPGNRDMFINAADGSGLGINIENIEYNPDLNQIDNIAASKTPNNNEDNKNALELSELRHKDIFSKLIYNDPDGGKYNADDFYRNLITDIGLVGQEARDAADGQRLLTAQIENRLMAVSGVSLDEEMSNLIKYEHSYNAAARIVNAMDEMIDVIVNKVGLVGR